MGEDRCEVEALEPFVGIIEPGGFEAGHVSVECVGYEYVFESLAFLADLGLGVAVVGFELVIDIVLEVLFGVGFKFHFFREDEYAAGTEPVVDIFDKFVSFGRVEELEGIVHNDDRRVFDIYIGYIGNEQFDGSFADVAFEDIGGTGDHGFGVVNGDDLAVGGLDAVAERDGAGTERAAEIVAVGAGLGVAFGEHGGHGKHSRIAWDRTADHIIEDGDDLFIEYEA